MPSLLAVGSLLLVARGAVAVYAPYDAAPSDPDYLYAARTYDAVHEEPGATYDDVRHEESRDAWRDVAETDKDAAPSMHNHSNDVRTNDAVPHVATYDEAWYEELRDHHDFASYEEPTYDDEVREAAWRDVWRDVEAWRDDLREDHVAEADEPREVVTAHDDSAGRDVFVFDDVTDGVRDVASAMIFHLPLHVYERVSAASEATYDSVYAASQATRAQLSSLSAAVTALLSETRDARGDVTSLSHASRDTNARIEQTNVRISSLRLYMIDATTRLSAQLAEQRADAQRASLALLFVASAFLSFAAWASVRARRRGAVVVDEEGVLKGVTVAA